MRPIDEAIASMRYALHDDSSKNLQQILYDLAEWAMYASDVAHREHRPERSESFYKLSISLDEALRLVLNHPELFKLFYKQKLI